MANTANSRAAPIVLGWREWVALPDLAIQLIKAKVDTGARSSALHASDLEVISTATGEHVRFHLHPVQGQEEPFIAVVLPLLEYREVRSSNGIVSRRPVVVTKVRWREIVWPVEFTLVDRRDMRFRVLLGRHALRRQLLVNPRRSFLGVGPPGTMIPKDAVDRHEDGL